MNIHDGRDNTIHDHPCCETYPEWADALAEEIELDRDEQWDDYDDSMDGDHESALASAGFGTDEDYGCFDSGDCEY